MSSPYFKDESSEYAFFLNELDGETRMKKLNINRYLYSNKSASKRWFDSISDKLMTCEEMTPLIESAMQQLEMLYSGMNYIDNEEEEEVE